MRSSNIVTRRAFLLSAAALGATAAWADLTPQRSKVTWKEVRERYPEGVASGDPFPDSVILWTRHPFPAAVATLTVEVATDRAFDHVVARTTTPARAAADWTCRVLVGGLRPRTTYWYRFTNADGDGSRIGRTRTAPLDEDDYVARFVFTSCQDITSGAQNAYRRMIYDDERVGGGQQIDFVFHQGDFIYEVVNYPEDRPQGYLSRRLRDVIRYPQGEKILDFHIPTTLEDYRTAYRAYLADPDLQDARARWPFINMWDNHEYSWLGYQGLQIFEGRTRPAQTRKVAANQAWFEYQPARVHKPRGNGLERFDAPHVVDAPVNEFDDQGLGREPNNLLAIESLRGYRSLRWGRHVELILTDQHSYRSEDPLLRPEAKPLSDDAFPDFIPEKAVAILDAGRAYAGGRPPDVIHLGGGEVPNFRKHSPPQTIFGAEQKRWFFDRLKRSTATWKLWGNTEGTLEWRADLHNLPPDLGKAWSGGYANMSSQDHSNAFTERAEIYDFVRAQGISGFGIVAGDRHSFWAGLAAPALPPQAFEPVGVVFIAGSISAPGLVEAYESALPRTHPLYSLYLAHPHGEEKPQPVVNMLMLHGVRSALEYTRTGDAEAARRRSNPDLSPHLAFLDLDGHGYAVVRATGAQLECEFVCIERPLERAERPDGGALRYRVMHRVPLWRVGEHPSMTQEFLEGRAPLSV